MHDFRTLQDHAGAEDHVRPAVQGRGGRTRPAASTPGSSEIGKEAPGHQRLPDEPQPQAERGGLGRERAQPRHRDQRRALQPRLARSARSTTSSASTSRAAACRPSVAERLIVLGFFDEVLDQLPVPDLAGPAARRRSRPSSSRRDVVMTRRAPCARSDDLPPGTGPPGRGRRRARSCVVRIGDDVYAIGDTCSHAERLAVRGRGARATSARSSAGSTAARSRW